MQVVTLPGPFDYMGPIRAKLERADKHFETISTEYEAIANAEGNHFEVIASPDLSQRAVLLVFEQPPPNERWSLLFSEAVHHMRSALDQTVFAIAMKEANSIFPPGEKSLMFPVCHLDNTEANWARVKDRIKTLSPEVRAAIKREQSGRDHEGLFVIDRLSNVDKHRSASVAATVPTNGSYRLTGAPVGVEMVDDWLHGPLDSETPFLFVRAKRPAPHMQVHDIGIQLSCRVEILDPKNPGGRAYLNLSTVKGKYRDAVHRVIKRLARAGKLD